MGKHTEPECIIAMREEAVVFLLSLLCFHLCALAVRFICSQLVGIQKSGFVDMKYGISLFALAFASLHNAAVPDCGVRIIKRKRHAAVCELMLQRDEITPAIISIEIKFIFRSSLDLFIHYYNERKVR
jgi:hypothetical protein